MTDFGADDSFSDAVEKLREHYGIEVPETAVRAVTLQHAEAMLERDLETELPAVGVCQLIAEMDGTDVPIVAIADAQSPDPAKDKRKLRKLEWREARLSMVRKPSEVSKLYKATMQGVQRAGEQLLDCAIAAGAGQKTRLHCVGDGAKWIASQVRDKFGEQASYLVDFYHMSEYLAAAGEVIAGEEKLDWLRQQQALMKENKVSEVLGELKRGLEIETDPKRQEPIRECERYLENRPGQFDYEGAMKAGLPIGSGEVESGHRVVIQARLKISGAWWKIENADKMLALRAMRANGEWQAYWERLRQAAA